MPLERKQKIQKGKAKSPPVRKESLRWPPVIFPPDCHVLVKPPPLACGLELGTDIQWKKCRKVMDITSEIRCAKKS